AGESTTFVSAASTLSPGASSLSKETAAHRAVPGTSERASSPPKPRLQIMNVPRSGLTPPLVTFDKTVTCSPLWGSAGSRRTVWTNPCSTGALGAVWHWVPSPVRSSAAVADARTILVMVNLPGSRQRDEHTPPRQGTEILIRYVDDGRPNASAGRRKRWRRMVSPRGFEPLLPP